MLMCCPPPKFCGSDADSLCFLPQLCWSVSGLQPILIRNDDSAAFAELQSRGAFGNIIISPGPGSPDRPQDFGICAGILLDPPAPVLGVCLGCQGIGWLYGLEVRKAPGGPMHGRTSVVLHETAAGGGGLFAGIPNGFKVVRYHSLALCPKTPNEPWPADLQLTAWTADGVPMGLQHRTKPLWGVQFHPESICTEYGQRLVANFLALAEAHTAKSCLPFSCHTPAPAMSSLYAYVKSDERRGSGALAADVESGGTATSKITLPAPPLPHKRLKLLYRRFKSKLDSETVYMTLLGADRRSFWLDSARHQPTEAASRFSYMGGSTGPLCYHLTYDLRRRSLEQVWVDGRKTRHEDCDVFAFVEQELQACQMAYSASSSGFPSRACDPGPFCEDQKGCEDQEKRLPFEFHGGLVGYLGYELKELCDDAGASPNVHQAQEPDAVLLFADRFLVWDHQEGHIYVVALADDEGEGVDDAEGSEESARGWLDTTESQLRSLSSLSLRQTIAAKHQAMSGAHAAGSACVTGIVTPPTTTASRTVADETSAAGQQAVGGVMRAGNKPSQPLLETLPISIPLAGAAIGGSDAVGRQNDRNQDEPPTTGDDGYEQEPSSSPSGPGALSFPPVKPTAPLFEGGPGSVPGGAKNHWENGDQETACCEPTFSRASFRAPAATHLASASIEGTGFVTADSQERYEAKVRKCLEFLVEGESYELCLTTRHRSSQGMRLDPPSFYQRLRSVNPAPYSALLRCGSTLTVCSSSPERFLRISSGGLCDSKPIKGTRRRGSSIEEDQVICQELRSCEKDLAENLMIVDLVRNDLGRVCMPGSVRCPKIMDVESFATVHQLVSTIEGQKLHHVSSVDVIRATFPMGSMTGAPKKRSLALLDQLESDARGVYSGAIGFLSLNGAVHLNVAIRTAVLTDDGVKVGAGGAITVLSDPRDEWEEMQLKAEALLRCAHALAATSL